jgi:hypothetical protein
MINKFRLLNQNDLCNEENPDYIDHWVEIRIDRNNWNSWEIYCINNRDNYEEIETRFDIDECRECQIISPEHLLSYFKWITKENIKK